jgi:hypothetical protein
MIPLRYLSEATAGMTKSALEGRGSRSAASIANHHASHRPSHPQ